MLRAAKDKPNADRCASVWLIKRFIYKEAISKFVKRDAEIPEGAYLADYACNLR
jgi:hypothetical protein